MRNISKRKGSEEACRLHLEDADWSAKAGVTISLVEPDWDPNDRNMPRLLQKYVLIGLKGGSQTAEP